MNGAPCWCRISSSRDCLFENKEIQQQINSRLRKKQAVFRARMEKRREPTPESSSSSSSSLQVATTREKYSSTRGMAHARALAPAKLERGLGVFYAVILPLHRPSQPHSLLSPEVALKDHRDLNMGERSRWRASRGKISRNSHTNCLLKSRWKQAHERECFRKTYTGSLLSSPLPLRQQGKKNKTTTEQIQRRR